MNGLAMIFSTFFSLYKSAWMTAENKKSIETLKVLAALHLLSTTMLVPVPTMQHVSHTACNSSLWLHCFSIGSLPVAGFDYSAIWRGAMNSDARYG